MSGSRALSIIMFVALFWSASISMAQARAAPAGAVNARTGSPATAPAGFSLEPVPVAGVDVRLPPPPVTADGVQAQGSWIGPFTYRNLNSGKCLDILGASTSDGAVAVQYRCVAGGRSQMWYIWETEGDGSVTYYLLGNAHSGKCLDAGNATRGGVVKQLLCNTYISTEIWVRTSQTMNIHRNSFSLYCMEVQGGSRNDFARIVQWDCHHRAHQVWLRYNV